MKQIVILGAGTGGTIMANLLSKQKGYKVTVIDAHTKHYYQPGFLFLPFGKYEEEELVQDRTKYLPKNISYINEAVDRVEADKNTIKLQNGNEVLYDLLVIATGSRVDPNETPGMREGWHDTIHTFYDIDSAKVLREKLKTIPEGDVIIHFSEMPIKCPVAPLEFAFLADEYFKSRGIREKINLKFVTPLDGAFTKPKASEKLGHLLKDKNITLIPDFGIERIDIGSQRMVSYDEKEVHFDLLITIPTNKGSEVIARSSLGDELDFVPTDHHTLQSKAHKNIFVIGDATDVPASKAGSVAHFEAHTVYHNIQRYFDGRELEASFDGHANCFVETGNKKGLLIDFNYEVEPLEGRFPFPLLGPLSLLKESRLNHIGKLAFKWIYWNIIIKGRKMPFVTDTLTLKGKKRNT